MNTENFFDDLNRKLDYINDFLIQEPKSKVQALAQYSIMFCERRDPFRSCSRQLRRLGFVIYNWKQLRELFRHLGQTKAVINEIEQKSKLRRRKQRFFELLFNIRPCEHCRHSQKSHGGKKYKAYNELFHLAQKLLGPKWANHKPHVLRYEKTK